MVRCYKNGCPDEAIMIRLHNTLMSAFFNHPVEAEIIKHFHSLDCGPKILATFEGGFCYEFIPGEILSFERLSEEPIWRRIAEEQAKMHCGTFECPPAFIKDGATFLGQAYAMVDAYPKQLKDPVQNERLKTEIPDKETLKKEFKESMDHALTFEPDLVLAHNDPRAENIIWNPNTGKAKFVDFEAVSYVYRALTLSLQLCRFAGEPIHYDLLPGEEMQKKWLRAYLEKYFSLTGRQTSDVTDRDVDRLYVQVTKFKPIVLFLSGIGMVVCDQTEALDNRNMDPVGACIAAVKYYFEQKDLIRAMQMPQ